MADSSYASSKYHSLSPQRPHDQSLQPGPNNGKDYVVIDQELIRGLSEKEIELEHLKTVIVALNQKVEVVEDIKTDLSTTTRRFKDSEMAREDLQKSIIETSETIRIEKEKNV